MTPNCQNQSTERAHTNIRPTGQNRSPRGRELRVLCPKCLSDRNSTNGPQADPPAQPSAPGRPLRPVSARATSARRRPSRPTPAPVDRARVHDDRPVLHRSRPRSVARRASGTRTEPTPGGEPGLVSPPEPCRSNWIRSICTASSSGSTSSRSLDTLHPGSRATSAAAGPHADHLRAQPCHHRDIRARHARDDVAHDPHRDA